MRLICYRPDGIEVIKRALSGADKGLEARYVSAPKYVLVGRGKNPKKLEALVKGRAEGIVREIEKSQGEASFELVKQ
jgi:translation initiation factor 2 alpha subunit (eIF-2alpha)